MRPFLGAFATAVVATPAAGRLARALGILDRPGLLKVQAEPVPYLGGLAVFAATAAGGARPRLLPPLALAMGLGLVDDRRGLSPSVRLAGEVGAGVLAAAAVPTRLGTPLGPLAVAGGVVVLVNAVNLIDGLDGLASGVALASALGFSSLPGGPERQTALALAGALAGFLVHNRPPARIYLGDAGSYLIGTALALLLAAAWGPAAPAGAGVAALALVGVPLAEVGVAVLRRALAGDPLFEGDRSHVYDQLVDRGWPARRASLTFAVAQSCLSALGATAARLRPRAAAGVVVAAGGALLAGAAAGGFLSPPRRQP